MASCKPSGKVILQVLEADSRIPRFPLKGGARFCAAA